MSGLARQTAYDVEHIDLRERLKVWLHAGVLLRAKPHRLHRLHPDVACTADVGVEPVADEQRPVGGDVELFERALEDLSARLANADLRREHHRVETRQELLLLEVAQQ